MFTVGLDLLFLFIKSISNCNLFHWLSSFLHSFRFKVSLEFAIKLIRKLTLSPLGDFFICNELTTINCTLQMAGVCMCSTQAFETCGYNFDQESEKLFK